LKSNDNRGFNGSQDERQKMERRRFHRVPVLRDLAELVDLRLPELHGNTQIPGILVNLSGGGMGIITFVPVPLETEIKLVLDIPSVFDKIRIEGTVVRSIEKQGSFLIGVKFTKVPDKAVKMMKHMGEDYMDCETKLSFGVTDVCLRACSYHPLCTKKVKI